MNYKDFVNLREVVRSLSDDILLLYFYKRNKNVLFSKQDGENFTSADIEMEQALVSAFKRVVGDAVLITEESTPDKNAIQIDVSKPTLFIDPLDGTNNFVAGNENFAVGILYQNSEDSIALIYLPTKKKMLSYHKAKGVMLNGQKIKPFSNISDNIKAIDMNSRLMALNTDYPVKKSGSCITSYFNLVDQKVDGLVFSKNLLPWDHAVGVFFLQKLNGSCALVDCTPYDPTPKDCTLIVTRNKKTWNKLQTSVKKWLPK